MNEGSANSSSISSFIFGTTCPISLFELIQVILSITMALLRSIFPPLALGPHNSPKSTPFCFSYSSIQQVILPLPSFHFVDQFVPSLSLLWMSWVYTSIISKVSEGVKTTNLPIFLCSMSSKQYPIFCEVKIKLSKTHRKFTSCDSAEPLLSSCIPDLELNPFSIKLNGSYFKINTA